MALARSDHIDKRLTEPGPDKADRLAWPQGTSENARMRRQATRANWQIQGNPAPAVPARVFSRHRQDVS